MHKPVPIDKAMKIPAARAAIDKEWDKLDNKPAWLFETVRSKRQVVEDAIRNKSQIHLGSVMVLCHLKNAQLGEEFWSYKGRIVFRGDCVKDENGNFAVFSEQGTSASLSWQLDS